MNKRPGCSPKVCERAVGLVLTSEHEHSARWSAIQSIVTKMGYTPETLRAWLNRMEVDAGTKPGVSSAQSKRMKGLERAQRALKCAHEMLQKGAVFFVQAALDRKPRWWWILLTRTANTVSSRARGALWGAQGLATAGSCVPARGPLYRGVTDEIPGMVRRAARQGLYHHLTGRGRPQAPGSGAASVHRGSPPSTLSGGPQSLR